MIEVLECPSGLHNLVKFEPTSRNLICLDSDCNIIGYDLVLHCVYVKRLPVMWCNVRDKNILGGPAYNDDAK